MVYDVRIPVIKTDYIVKDSDIVIEADNENDAYKIAELVERGGMVDLRYRI